MKHIIFIITCLLLCPFAAAQERLLGGDISLLPSYEAAGTVYRTAEGEAVELLPYLKSEGWNCLRVRLFVDPEQAPGDHKDEGVCQDLPYVVGLAQRIKAEGFRLMLDFHYSDTWADPGKQYIPSRWQSTRRKDLPDSLYRYTLHCLRTLAAAGAEPDLIQVGNEITFGMLWPEAKVEPKGGDNWPLLIELLEAGTRACREVCPQAKIIIHTEKAGEWEQTKAYYDRLAGLDYDAIGLSYYPIWHKAVGVLVATCDSLSERFPEKEVMIVETAGYYSHENDRWAKPDDYAEHYPITPEGQRIFVHELVEELRRHPSVTALLWWFPEENAHGNSVTKGWLNRGLFDNRTGRVLPAMGEFKRYMLP